MVFATSSVSDPWTVFMMCMCTGILHSYHWFSTKLVNKFCCLEDILNSFHSIPWIIYWPEGVFQLSWTSGHAMRLNSRTGIEGPPVSSLNCDRHYTQVKRRPSCNGCRLYDNRWTASLCMSPPGCSPLVPLTSQDVGGAWASLGLPGCKHTGKGMFQRNPVLAGHLKYTYTRPFKQHTYMPLLLTVAAQHYSPHTVGVCCGASLSADCSYNPGWCRSHLHRLHNDL